MGLDTRESWSTLGGWNSCCLLGIGTLHWSHWDPKQRGLRDLLAAGGVPERQRLDGPFFTGERVCGQHFTSPPSAQLFGCLKELQILHIPCWWLSPEVLSCTCNQAHLVQQHGLCCLVGRRSLFQFIWPYLIPNGEAPAGDVLSAPSSSQAAQPTVMCPCTCVPSHLCALPLCICPRPKHLPCPLH